MIKKAYEIVNYISPKIADVFGLKPAFVTCLGMILCLMCFGIFNLDRTFREQNKVLTTSLQSVTDNISMLTDKVTSNTERIATLEGRVDREKEENTAFRFQLNESIAKISTKLDMTMASVQDLTRMSMNK